MNGEVDVDLARRKRHVFPRKRRVELRFAVHALMAASAYLFIAALVIAA